MSFTVGETATDGGGSLQDESGWTPLMIAASVKDAEPLVDLLLDRGANVDEKSKWPPIEKTLPFKI